MKNYVKLREIPCRVILLVIAICLVFYFVSLTGYLRSDRVGATSELCSSPLIQPADGPLDDKLKQNLCVSCLRAQVAGHRVYPPRHARGNSKQERRAKRCLLELMMIVNVVHSFTRRLACSSRSSYNSQGALTICPSTDIEMPYTRLS